MVDILSRDRKFLHIMGSGVKTITSLPHYKKLLPHLFQEDNNTKFFTRMSNIVNLIGFY